MEREHWETGGEEERGEGDVLMAEKETFSDEVVMKEVAMVNTECKVAEERHDAASSSPLTFVPAENLSSDGVVDELSTCLPETSSLLPSLVEVDNEQGSANLPPAVPVVTRGQAPPSTIGDLIHYGRGVADQTHFPPTIQTQHNVLSSRGQAPPTTIQNILYHLTSDEATPPEPYEATPTIGEFPCAPPQPYTLSYPQLG